MIQEKQKEISTKTVILAVLLYSFLTNIKDVKNGFLDGWNAIKVEAKNPR